MSKLYLGSRSLVVLALLFALPLSANYEDSLGHLHFLYAPLFLVTLM